MGDSFSPIELGDNFIADGVKAGAYFTCIRGHYSGSTDGVVKCFGKNDIGQLGYGDTSYRGQASSDMGYVITSYI